jgi:hypothetical protein
MNISIQRDLRPVQAYYTLHHEVDTIDVLFNLQKIKKTPIEDIKIQYVLDIFRPLLKFTKLLVVVKEKVSFFGLCVNITFEVFLDNNKTPKDLYGFCIMQVVQKFGASSDQIIIEERISTPSMFGPDFRLIFDSKVELSDEMFNLHNQSQVLADCPILGFMLPEYSEPYPLVYSATSFLRIKPRLCSACVYYNHRSIVSCAVNLTPIKDKMKIEFDCTDYKFNEAKYQPVDIT